ncbi:MAG: pyridoxamine 5'-phosphate oxidase family protein [Aeromicrobium sp.]
MAFSDDEMAYLRAQPVARLATVNADGGPDVVPVAFKVDDSAIWVGGIGAQVLKTRKFRNIGAGRAEVSLVVDDWCRSIRSSPGQCAFMGSPNRRSNGLG